jgi:succinylglutamate desuccinylase
LLLHKNIDQFNFTELPVGTVLGKVNGNGAFPLSALNDEGNDAARQFFRVREGHLELARATMPSMLTLNEDVIRQDCLCYLMERLSLPTQSSA